MNKISTLLTVLLACQTILCSALSDTAHAKTRLIQLDAGAFQEGQTGKIWQVNRSRKVDSVWEVQEYLEQLNQGEYNDWRLPTKEELFELFSIFDLKNNGEITLRLEGPYWLIDDQGGMFTGAWEIGDQCGPTRTFYSAKSGHIRAVRP